MKYNIEGKQVNWIHGRTAVSRAKDNIVLFKENIWIQTILRMKVQV